LIGVTNDALVKSEPGGQQMIAAKSDHYIMLQQPGLVIGAVSDVVGSVRSSRN
jgi:hypothetical protein